MSCIQFQFPKLSLCNLNWFIFLDSISTIKYKITATPICWNGAQSGYTLNTDGSATQNGLSSSGGGILRAPGGKIIFAYSLYFGQGTNMCAESLALLVGLIICDKLVITNINVRCDSKILVDMLNGKVSMPWHIRPIIKKISRYKGGILEFKHCFREANTVADALAKEGNTHHNNTIYTCVSQLTQQVRALISLDSMNVSNLRFSKYLSLYTVHKY